MRDAQLCAFKFRLRFQFDSPEEYLRDQAAHATIEFTRGFLLPCRMCVSQFSQLLFVNLPEHARFVFWPRVFPFALVITDPNPPVWFIYPYSALSVALRGYFFLLIKLPWHLRGIILTKIPSRFNAKKRKKEINNFKRLPLGFQTSHH